MQNPNPKRILYVALLTSFMTTFMGSALNLSIPNLETDFQVGAALISTMHVIFGVFIVLCLIGVVLSMQRRKL